MIDEPDVKPGDSQVQRDAERMMVAWLEIELECELKPRRIVLPDKSWLELDAYCRTPLIVCEAWAHQGPPKSAQKMKVMNDAMKLVAARRVVGEEARAILLFADEAAAARFSRRTWHATALQEARIEVMIAELSGEVRDGIRAAQIRQFR